MQPLCQDGSDYLGRAVVFPKKDPELVSSVGDPSVTFDELVDALADIHNLSKTNVPFRVFSNSTFSGSRNVLDRLVVPNYNNDDLFL